jgi:hypothetical protein
MVLGELIGLMMTLSADLPSTTKTRRRDVT